MSYEVWKGQRILLQNRQPECLQLAVSLINTGRNIYNAYAERSDIILKAAEFTTSNIEKHKERTKVCLKHPPRNQWRSKLYVSDNV